MYKLGTLSGMRANAVIMEMVGLLWRYVSAILVTFVVSALVILLGATIIDKGVIGFLSGAHNHPMYPTATFAIAFTAAFWGIQLGGLCLPARSRVLACVALVVMGLAYYMTYWYVYWRHEAPSKHGNDPLLFQLLTKCTRSSGIRREFQLCSNLKNPTVSASTMYSLTSGRSAGWCDCRF